MIQKEFIIHSRYLNREKEECDPIPDDCILLSSDTYQKIFGKKLKETGFYPWKRKIVKISFFDDQSMSHRSIYRLWKGLNPNYISKDIAYINVQGQIILFGAKSDGNKKYLELSKGSKYMFFWRNENSVIRCSFKLGCLSVFLGILSLFLGVLSLI